VRAHLRRSAFRVGGLDAEQHQLGASHGADFRAGLDRHMRLEGLRIEQQAVAADRLDVLRPADQHHRMAGTRQHAAVIATHRARTHDCNLHRQLQKLRSRMVVRPRA
jgi:hypothetical protein